jgi:hypothetical protein
MGWTTPITHYVGDPIVVSDFNTYVRDNTNFLFADDHIGLFGSAGALCGGGPGPGHSSGVQGGSFTQVTGTGVDVGQVTLTFPTPYPNGLLTVVAMSGDGTGGLGNLVIQAVQSASPASASSVLLSVTTGNTGVPVSGTGVRVNWIALGF